MAITITADKLNFDGEEFKKGDVTASKSFETKRKSDDGIPLKRLRAFNSASTFIDFNTERRGQVKGQSLDVFVKDTYEALHIDPYLVSLGAKNNMPLHLTGSIKTFTSGETQTSTFLAGKTGFDEDNYGIIFDNGIITTGILTVDNALSIAPGTGLINGALGVMGGVGNSQIISQDTIVQPNYNMILYVNNNNDSITINSGINYTISTGADVTIKKP